MTTEKRLIDACALNRNIDCCDFESSQDYYTICEQIVQAPTVDAVEVVHSQWDTVFYASHGTLSSYTHICPECKFLYKNLRFEGYNYCPECGAKMDGDGNA